MGLGLYSGQSQVNCRANTWRHTYYMKHCCFYHANLRLHYKPRVKIAKRALLCHFLLTIQVIINTGLHDAVYGKWSTLSVSNNISKIPKMCTELLYKSQYSTIWCYVTVFGYNQKRYVALHDLMISNARVISQRNTWTVKPFFFFFFFQSPYCVSFQQIMNSFTPERTVCLN